MMASARIHFLSQALFRAVILITLFVVIESPENVIADNQQPKQFFQDGYVVQSLPKTGTHQQHLPAANPQLRESGVDYNMLAPTEKKEGPSSANAGFSSLDDEPSESTESERSEKALTALEEEKTIPITALSLALNAKTPDETFAMIKKYTETLKEYDLTPKAIYTMQIPQFIVRDAPTHWASVIVRGGYIEMNRDIVEQYGIKRVPTWIANTEEGDVIFEGYEDISAFLSSKGELRRSQLQRYADESKDGDGSALQDPREILEASLSENGDSALPDAKKAIDALKASLKMPQQQSPSQPAKEDPQPDPAQSPKEMHESHFSVIPQLDQATTNGEVGR